FSSGGGSHMDTFDYKPKLFQAGGKSLGIGGGLSLGRRPLLKPRWGVHPRGACRTPVSGLFSPIPHCIEGIFPIPSMTTANNEHFEAPLAVHTGSFFFARPSLGAWLSYGLGTLNQNLPSFIVIAPYLPFAGAQVWANDFLPTYHQGTHVTPGKHPIPNVTRQ